MATEYVEVTQTAPVSIDVEIGPQPEEFFVGPAAPTFTTTGVWLQTGLGTSGNDYTIWFEDGE